eukprot:216745-Hanusia_phi.AAC.1
MGEQEGGGGEGKKGKRGRQHTDFASLPASSHRTGSNSHRDCYQTPANMQSKHQQHSRELGWTSHDIDEILERLIFHTCRSFQPPLQRSNNLITFTSG